MAREVKPSLTFAPMLLPRLAKRAMTSRPPISSTTSLRGVMLDLDGTLTAPHAIDFDKMRRRIGMSGSQGSVLHWIASNAASAAERAAHLAVVEEEERLGLARMRLNAGFGDLVDALRKMRVPAAIATRNGPEALDAFRALLAAEGFGDGDGLFCVQLARDHFSQQLGRVVLNKPSAEPAHEILRRWQLGDVPLADCHEADVPVSPGVVFCGDNLDDCLCGRRAGLASVFVTNKEETVVGGYAHRVLSHPEKRGCIDHVVGDLSELASLLLRMGAEYGEDGTEQLASPVS